MAKNTTARCRICTTRPAIGGIRGSVEATTCYPCLNYGEWENTHSDESHEYYWGPEATAELQAEGDALSLDGQISRRADCPVCQGEPDPAEIEYVAPTGHTSGGPKTGSKSTSHAGCSHPATKSGRAKCRAERAKSAE